MKKNTLRLYGDLAWIWPAWGSPDHYRPVSERFAELINKHAVIPVETLLDLGCGGGKNMFTLKNYFRVTGLDISSAMLGNAETLNPECDFIVGDMRDFEVKSPFDAILVNDSITYMTTRKDFRRVFRAAYRNLKPGGILITCPDTLKESFRNNNTQVWSGEKEILPDHIEITYIENNFDPDPKDTSFETTFIYLIREHGRLRIEKDFHLCGIFSRDFWIRTLQETGFNVMEETCPGNEENSGETLPLFVCRRPFSEVAGG